MDNITEYRLQLSQLFTGLLPPRQVVGSGYRYPKQAASQWLIKQIHNLENPDAKVDQILLLTSGKPFASEAMAKNSRSYQQLITGSFKLINDAIVTDYGVMPAPGGEVNAGYCIYIITAYRPQQPD